MQKPVYEINGNEFATLEEFFEVVSRILIPGAKWGHNLDAFNDILHGGFGTPEGGFVLRWANSEGSRERLGYVETIRQLKDHLICCHPSNRPSIGEDIQRAREGVGSTVFDQLVEIIQDHRVGGDQRGEVELILA